VSSVFRNAPKNCPSVSLQLTLLRLYRKHNTPNICLLPQKVQPAVEALLHKHFGRPHRPLRAAKYFIAGIEMAVWPGYSFTLSPVGKRKQRRAAVRLKALFETSALVAAGMTVFRKL
jgi:hypothetical protein